MLAFVAETFATPILCDKCREEVDSQNVEHEGTYVNTEAPLRIDRLSAMGTAASGVSESVVPFVTINPIEWPPKS